MSESEEPKEGFVVRDRRRFNAEGENKPVEESRKEEPPPKEVPRETPAPEYTAHPSENAETSALPPLDFTGFVMNLAHTALYHLGLLKLPDGSPHKDLAAAKQTIDILALLEEKTKGNLTQEEAAFLKDTLFQLRMAFVELSR
jgi:hypothetical protein